MLQRLKQRLKDNRGDAFIISVFMASLMLMIFYCLLTFTQLKLTTKNIRDTAQDALDNYTTTQGRLAIQSFKSGNDHTVTLDENTFRRQFYTALGTGSDLIGYDGNSKTRFSLTDLRLSYKVSNEINISITFKIHEPLYFFGLEVKPYDDTITVTSKYNPK